VEGTTQACYTGPAGTEGVGECASGLSTCDASGVFGACMGDTVPMQETCDGLDNDCNGMVDDGAGCVCAPGTAMPCYEGPNGTQGVGACKGGTAMCAADGKSYGACMGQTLPSVETCDGIDNDCNGMIDDGPSCNCTAGETKSCYSGPAGTAGVGVCMAGLQTCLPDGSAFGACMNEVLPSLENCAAPADEDCSGASALCTGNHVTSKAFGDALAQTMNDVATDAQGNVYVIGSFAGSLAFGGAIGTLTSAGGTDVLVAKLDNTGTVLWAKRYGNTADQVGNAIAVDPTGNVVITGAFQGTVNFGAGTQTSFGGDDLFVAKLDPNGTQLWARAIGNTATQQGLDISTDAAGDVYVTGEYSGDITFGGKILQGVDGLEAFLLKYSSAGSALWGKGFTGIGTQFGYSVSAKGTNQVTIAGAFQNSVDYGGGALTSAGDYDIVVARYDAGGTHLWSKRYGDVSNQRARAVAVDPSGNALVTGEFAGSMTIGATTLTSTDGAANVDGFVMKLDPMGNATWSKKFGGTTAQRGKGITTDVFGNVSLTGEFFGQMDLGSGSVTSAGGRDVFVGKLDPAGTALWLRRYGTGMMTNQQGEGIATDPMANVWVVGSFENVVDFGGGPFTSAGTTDMFVVKLEP